MQTSVPPATPDCADQGGAARFLNTPAHLERVGKAGIVVLASLFALGLLVTNTYLLQFGLSEFGLLRENGELKVLGAGLLSSPGELLHSLNPETPRYEFDIERVADTASAPYGYHEHYFILNSLDHLHSIVYEYAELEGLPKPALPV